MVEKSFGKVGKNEKLSKLNLFGWDVESSRECTGERNDK
jgi:hypothetical protein